MKLTYTGHPFNDVGLATIVAMSEKNGPEELEESDLEKMAAYIQENYVVNPLKSFLTVAFPNSGFVQPAYESQPEKRIEYAQVVSQAYQQDDFLDEIDPFNGLPVPKVRYSLKNEIPLGYAFREHVPLLTGHGYINFHAEANNGLPLSGVSLLIFQALPMGCFKVSGKLLAVHSDDATILQKFAAQALLFNRKAVLAAKAAQEKKMPENERHARTLLIEKLSEIEQQRKDLPDETPATLTAYHFSNSGQGAELTIYPLPMEVGDFLRSLLRNPKYETSWKALVQRGWQLVKSKKSDTLPQYNRLYEDLFNLPENAGSFISTYLLRRPTRQRSTDDPTTTYTLHKEANLISWDLTNLFLRKVLKMEKNRIEQIRILADALADYISQENDQRLFTRLLYVKRYDDLRIALIKASQASVRLGKPPLVTLDGFVEVFEVGNDLPYADWKLGRDLLLIRLIEQLYQKSWLQTHVDQLPVESDEADQTE